MIYPPNIGNHLLPLPGKGVRAPDSVEIDGCSMNRCVVRNQQKVTVFVSTRIPVAAHNLTIHGVVSWFLFSRSIDFSRQNRNLCRRVDPRCPFRGGELIETKFSFLVNAPFAGITPKVQLTVLNEKHRPVFCGSMQVTIVN